MNRKNYDNNAPSDAVTDWFVYIIEANDGTLYTGITNNLLRRWQQHCSQKGGAKFFRGRKPAYLRLVENVPDRSRASQREAAIKKLSRTDKLTLIARHKNTLLDQHILAIKQS